jgi:hypothetical protein
MEGILPEELVYTPLSEFQIKGLDPQVASMRHDYHEARRQDLLAVLRHRRQKLLLADDVSLPTSTTSPAPTLLGSTAGSNMMSKSGLKSAASPQPPKKRSPGLIAPGEHNPMDAFVAPGSPPASAPFVRTYDFFNYWHKELDPHKETPKELELDEDGSPKKNPTPQLYTSGTCVGSTSYNPSQNKMQAHEESFHEQLKMMRTCSGNGRLEHDFAKNTENNLVALRADADKARTASQANDRLSTKCKSSMEKHTFSRLKRDTLENKAYREHREVMSRPASLPRNLQAEARHQLVFESIGKIQKAQVDRRRDFYGKEMEVTHARTEKLVQESLNTKIAFAQQTMHDRLRWRENHHINVTLKHAKYEEDKKRMFLQREEDFVRRQAISDNRGAIRQELHRMRHIDRQQTEERRARKMAYERNKKKAEVEDWKASVNAEAQSLHQPPMKSNLNSTWPMSPASLKRAESSASLAMSRPVPTHLASPMAASNRSASTGRLFASWYRHG